MRALRQALRSLLRSRPFAATAAATVAVVIALNATVFSVMHAVVLSPLPYRDSGRLVAVWMLEEGENGEPRRPTPGAFVAWRKQARVFSGVAGFNGSLSTLTGAGDPVALEGSRVSDGYFDVLGIAPLLGRSFRPDDAFPESAPVVLLSDRLWRERFGSDAAILGRPVLLNGAPRTVVGVMPSRFLPSGAVATGRMEFSDAPAYWIPAPFSGAAAAAQNTSHVLGVVARLAPGVDPARAENELSRFERARRLDAGGRAIGARVRPLADEAEGRVRPALVLVWGAVLFVLLIACVNVANLHVARSESRRREVAIRFALGGSRVALVRQLLLESVLLAAAGGIAGVLLAYWTLPLLVRLAPSGVPRISEAALSPATVGFSILLALAAGAAFGLLPALHATRSGAEEDPGIGLQGSRSGSPSRRTRRTLATLVLAEVALASLLVVGAGLLTRSFGRLLGVDLGFRGDRVLVVPFSLPKSTYDTAAKVGAFEDELLRQTRATRGVAAAAIAYNHPLEAQWGGVPRVAGRPRAREEAERSAWFRSVSEGYFGATGVALRAGRDFDAHDDASHPGVAIVNEAFARREFPGENPLGRRLESSDAIFWWGKGLPEEFTIVGVAADVRFLGRDKPPEPAYYLPARQFPIPDMKLLVRPAAAADPMSLLPTVRSAVRKLDPAQPIGTPTTIAALLDESLAQPRFAMRLMLAFAVAGLALAALGIYGLLTFAVTLRTREIGVRMALGARTRDIVGLVLAEAGPLAAGGAVLGAVASLAISPVLRSVLFGVSPSDPVSVLAAPAILGAVALGASLMPARRAARVDPSVSLRNE